MPRFSPFILIMLTPSSKREAEAACEEPSVCIDGQFGVAGIIIDECRKRV